MAKIAIIGSGNVGSALARGLTRAGGEVRTAKKADAKEKAQWGELVILAVPFPAVGDVIREHGDVLKGKTIVDVTNALTPDMKLALGYSTSGAEELQKRLPSARVVIAVRSAATGEVRELPLPIALEYPRPQWAADGSALIVLARENGRSGFYRVDAQTGQTALLFRALGAVTEFQVNPDGRSLTYKSSRASASTRSDASLPGCSAVVAAR
jgi:hypothetical protein